MLKLAIIGDGVLAEATRICCRDHFHIDPQPSWDTNVVWFCDDTPIDADGKPDADAVIAKISQEVRRLSPFSLILVSSQLPVGSTARLEKEFPRFQFAYQPENVRVKTSVADFRVQARVVVGIRSTAFNSTIDKLFSPFTSHLIITTPETAECCKHFLNTYLALCIVFANEMDRLCKLVGADAAMVAKALRCERRVSDQAPLLPGGPYAGGHLERDIWVLTHLAQQHGVEIPVIAHLQASNQLTPTVRP